MSFKAAILGLGNIGRSVIRALETVPDAECIGVVRRPTSVGTTPYDLRGWMETRPDDAQAYLDEAGAGLLLCAHTHRPGVMPLKRGALVNTGSVGVPTVPGLIQFALLHGENGAWRPELVSLPYDPEEAIAEFSRDGFLDEAGLWPVMMMKQLREGGEQAIPFVARAHQLWQGEGQPPEDIWRQAARDVGIIDN